MGVRDRDRDREQKHLLLLPLHIARLRLEEPMMRIIKNEECNEIHTHLLVFGYALLGLRELVARSLFGHGVLIVVGSHREQLSFSMWGR